MLTVVMVDQGPVEAHRSGLARVGRGRGLLLIEKLAAEFELVPRASGTLVRMRWPCPRPVG
ncbi:hypothetical protein [Kutzneria sp. NPDC051319]|uniref:hypothetical protein n=1 Tax=Kutzneria sp. NPDC051319 TaxID=3155047 RepID=UPI00343E77E2